MYKKIVSVSLVLLIFALTFAVFPLPHVKATSEIWSPKIDWYWDEAMTIPVESIDWGMVVPGYMYSKTIYGYNAQDVWILCSMSVGDYSPGWIKYYFNVVTNMMQNGEGHDVNGYVSQLFGNGTEKAVNIGLYIKNDINKHPQYYEGMQFSFNLYFSPDVVNDVDQDFYIGDSDLERIAEDLTIDYTAYCDSDFTGPNDWGPDGWVDTYDLSLMGKWFGISYNSAGGLYLFADVTFDGSIGTADLALLGKQYGLHSGGWWREDVTRNCHINVLDLGQCGEDYGKMYYW